MSNPSQISLMLILTVSALGCTNPAVKSIDIRGIEELQWREITYPAYTFTSDSTLIEGSILGDELLDARFKRVDFEVTTGRIRIEGQIFEKGTDNAFGPARLMLSRLRIRDSVILCTNRRVFETTPKGSFDLESDLHGEDYLIISSFTYRPMFYRIGLLRSLRR
jgi:hypothetical protein